MQFPITETLLREAPTKPVQRSTMNVPVLPFILVTSLMLQLPSTAAAVEPLPLPACMVLTAEEALDIVFTPT